MNGLIRFWAKNAVAANLLMVLAILGGFIGFSRLEKETFPGGEFNGATIHIVWPGASPRDVEEQLILRVEEAVADIDGLDEITSVASESIASIYVKAINSVENSVFLDEVKLRIDTINNFPPSAYRPDVRPWRIGNEYIGLVVFGDVPVRDLKQLAEQIRDEIARLPGGELAQVVGTLEEEVTIELSESDMRRYRLTFDEVASAIRKSSLNSSGGEVRTDNGRIAIQTRHLADTPRQFEQIVLRQTENGGVIRLGDVARVIDGFEDGELVATYNEMPASFVFMPQTERMDLPRYARAIEGYVKDKNAELPPSVHIDVLWSDNDFMGKLISIIGNSAVSGTLMVLVVLILFLRPVVAFWVAGGIFISFAGGFMILPAMGVSLNILTLFACLLVIGIVVDDAIVIGENIHTEVESGRRDGVEAAVHGTLTVAKPVLFGVVTTIIAFAPWALISGDQRQFTQNFTLTVVAALSFSLVEALLILPSHLSHLKPQTTEGRMGRFVKFQRGVADSLLFFSNRYYRPVLETAVRFRYVTAAAFIALFTFAVGLVANGYVPFKLTPDVEGDLVMVEITMPTGTPFARTQQVRSQLARGVEALKEEENPRWSHLGFDIVQGASLIATDDSVQAFIGLAKPEFRPASVSSRDLAEKLRDLTGPIPDAEDTQFKYSFTQSQTRVQFSLNHSDLGVLRAATDDLKAHLATYANVYNPSDNLSSSASEIRLDLKPGAQSLGLSLADISRQVRQAYYGEEVQRLPRGGDDVRVMLKLPEEARRSLDSLDDFRVRTADGREIPLREVANVSFAEGLSNIYRRDRERTVTISAEVAPEKQGEITAAVTKDYLPALERAYHGLHAKAIGEAESQKDFFAEIISLQGMALFLMYMLLAIAFRSYFQPLLIMTAIPFGFAGAVFGHWIAGVPLAMFSWFGIAAAAGVVINDNLVLIDFLNRRREHGAGALHAVVEAGVARFRPILLTSVTTFVGILPMIMDRSTQAQFLKPMVLSLGSAVVFALFVSLLLVPALYAIGVETRRLVMWMARGETFKLIGDGYDAAKVDTSGDPDADIPDADMPGHPAE